ncbi:Leucine-rich repeat-containing protein 59 [Takifugu flavidus]|uniref:Leucine-rich repeat-containing protein 59 n=1 Tax=Takifugu flavidus TaxID=433684 RepID=A0A5C6PTL3_9TELE|nr:Leucine-rich repeat-containing protein 59 [Takifugu flavidus]
MVVESVVKAADGGRLCSYQDVLNYLNLTKSNELFFMTRPVKDYQQPTVVSVELLLYAILDVIEIAQTFVPYVWIDMTSDMTMRSQYEWLFVSMTVTNKTVDMFDLKQDMLIYTAYIIWQITMKRQSLLYIVNFLLPILFLLSLDIASFFISEREGEKLGFKVTVLLAVTVMQLLLNEILPSSSDQIPLIVVYCIGIFGLMMLSLLETILVMYLMEKDDGPPEDVKMSKNSKVLNLKDKINDNEMDLSLCNLSEVPVKELPEFCNLTHLVKVDLSKNQLTCLPDDLGNLTSLQHLDLYNNKLTLLPVSFSQLRNLRWLDLKDNPLEPNLAKAAGDCLDEKQCKQCASRVLQHMRVIQEDADRAREKRLLREKEIERKKEAKQREREAREKEARKREKAEEKEKRRKEYNAQMEALAAREQQKKKSEEKKKKKAQAAGKKAPAESPLKPRRSFLRLVFRLLLLLLLGLAGVAAVCHLTDMKKEAMCVPVTVAVDNGLLWAGQQQDALRRLVQSLSAALRDFLESSQASKN